MRPPSFMDVFQLRNSIGHDGNYFSEVERIKNDHHLKEVGLWGGCIRKYSHTLKICISIKV
eukprot:c33199_g1_i1 orf=7-189(-)